MNYVVIKCHTKACHEAQYAYVEALTFDHVSHQIYPHCTSMRTKALVLDYNTAKALRAQMEFFHANKYEFTLEMA